METPSSPGSAASVDVSQRPVFFRSIVFGRTATLGSIQEEVLPSVTGASNQVIAWTGTITANALKQSMVFFQERYLFGLATLDVETRRLQTKRPAQFPESKDKAGREEPPRGRGRETQRQTEREREQYVGCETREGGRK